MYFSNDKIVRKNFFITSIIALPFGRWQLLVGLFHLFYVIVCQKGDTVKDPMKSMSLVPKNVPGWGGVGDEIHKVWWVG